jgi:hypothetical protein
MLNVQAAIATADRAKRRLTGRMPVVEDYEGGKRDEREGESAVPRASMLVLTGMPLRSDPAHH